MSPNLLWREPARACRPLARLMILRRSYRVGLILVASDWQFCYNEIAFAITRDVIIHFG